MASVVLGIFGGSILAIVCGFVARSRIKRSDGGLKGRGLATAGIVLGFAGLAILATVITLFATGVINSENADDYSGQEREVAEVVDRVETALDEGDGPTACQELFTPRWARQIATADLTSCEQSVETALEEDEFQVDIDVESISVAGARATARVDEAGDKQTWTFMRGPDGRWRLDEIDSALN